jgi:uncharacterized protein (DUF2141 family)
MTVLRALVFAVSLMSLSAPAAPPAHLTITVNGVHSSTGTVFIAVYDSDSSFMNQPQAKVRARSKATKGQMTFVIPYLPKGNYAVASYHDENDNGKMDANSLGIPTEGYGFSNDAQGNAGPPKYSQAAFEFDGKTDKTVAFSLNY